MIPRTALRSSLALTVFMAVVRPGAAQDRPRVWLPSNGPFAGVIRALLNDERNSLYIATATGMLRCPENSYRGEECDPRQTEVTCLTMNSSYDLFVGTATGMWKTTDHGEHWTQITERLRINTIAVDRDDRVYFAAPGGIFTSANHGKTWAAFGTDGQLSGIRSLTACPDGSLLAATGDHIYRTSDGGTSWHVTMKQAIIRGVVTAPDSTTYAAVTDEAGAMIFASGDGGRKWTRARGTFPRADIRALVLTMTGTLLANVMPRVMLDASPHPTERADTLYRSTDRGESWHVAQTDLPITTFGVRFDNVLLAGTGGEGLYRSTDDGASWQQVGLAVSDVRDLTCASDGRLFACVEGRRGLFVSTDRGSSWTPATRDGTVGSLRALRVVDGKTMMAISERGIVRSDDGGRSWTRFTSDPRVRRATCLFPFTTQELLAGTPEGMYHTVNGGETWVSACRALADSSVAYLTADANGRIYAGGEGTGTYVSADRGASWKRLKGPRLNARTLGVDLDGRLYTGGSQRRSDDGGQTWTWIPLPPVNAYAVNRSGHVFAATDRGVLSSTNGGRTWLLMGDELSRLRATALCIDGEGYLYVGTRGGGVFRTEHPTVPPGGPR